MGIAPYPVLKTHLWPLVEPFKLRGSSTVSDAARPYNMMGE